MNATEYGYHVPNLREAHGLLANHHVLHSVPGFSELMNRIEYCILNSSDTVVRKQVEHMLDHWLHTGKLK